MAKILNKVIILQSQDVREGVEQFKVTLPADWINMQGWKKGTALKVSMIVDDSKILIEEAD